MASAPCSFLRGPTALACLALAVLTTGCLSARARQASRAEDYETAATLYDRTYIQRGYDSARRKRDLARTRHVDEELDWIDKLQRIDRPRVARARLDELLERTRGWRYRFGPDQAATLDTLVAWAAGDDHRSTRALLEHHRPLDARYGLPERSGLRRHPAYRRARRAVTSSIAAEGARRCQALGQRATTWDRFADLVALYCREFQAEPAPALEPVAACDRVRVHFDGDLPRAEQKQLATEVQALLRHTPYLHRRGDCVIDVDVRATRVAQTYDSYETKIAEYTVRVASVSTPKRSVPGAPSVLPSFRMPPYTVTDSYTVSRPQSSVRGASSASPSFVSSCCNTEVVTSCRPATHRYRVRHVTHTFDAKGALTLSSPTIGEPIRLRWSSRDVRAGIEHDEHVPEAGLHPTTVPVPPRRALVEGDHTALQEAWKGEVEPRLEADLCHGGADVELALECLLFVHPEAVPLEGREALAEAFGESYESLVILVSRWGPQSPRPLEPGS